uniref:Uncharacterized protein n=1 Tax=Coccidioides posadasii RMSCC 3488 TaxID=454284 RepID=A0A0J6FDF6_COCPO|nr:hypothetical protein CPAG_04667 [Coccidioides posadasii RMSCC 3488]
MEQPQKQRRAILHRMLKARIRSLETAVSTTNPCLGLDPAELARLYDSSSSASQTGTSAHAIREKGKDWLGYLPYNSVVTRELLEPGVFREHYWMKQCASYLGPIQLNASVSSRGWLTKDGMAKSFRLDNPNTSG